VFKNDQPHSFVWPVRVYYEDTDAGGVVFYANYLKFMERARTEWLRSVGLDQGRLRAEAGRLFVVRHAALDFRAPARLDDHLEVTVDIARVGGASLEFEQRIRRAGTDADCCRGRVKVACVCAETMRPKSLPNELLAEIADVR
jgi:acyl-CoA thioester hydrolase